MAWDEIKRVANANSAESLVTLQAIEQLDSYTMREIELPSVKESYFKSLSEIGRPSAETEEVSHNFNIPFAIKILSGASWQSAHYNGTSVFGAWDMGEVDLFLTKPIYKTTLTQRGIVHSESSLVPGKFQFDDETAENCSIGFHFGGESIESAPTIFELASTPPETVNHHRARKHRVNISSAPVDADLIQNNHSKDDTLFFFYSREPIKFKEAQVVRSKIQKLQSSEINKSGGKPSKDFEYGVTKYYDINHDGIHDFAVWEGMRLPVGDVDPEINNRPVPNYRLIFANIGGQWYLLDDDNYVYMCGC
jgi:hypothetical protein